MLPTVHMGADGVAERAPWVGWRHERDRRDRSRRCRPLAARGVPPQARPERARPAGRRGAEDDRVGLRADRDRGCAGHVGALAGGRRAAGDGGCVGRDHRRRPGRRRHGHGLQPGLDDAELGAVRRPTDRVRDRPGLPRPLRAARVGCRGRRRARLRGHLGVRLRPRMAQAGHVRAGRGRRGVRVRQVAGRLAAHGALTGQDPLRARRPAGRARRAAGRRQPADRLRRCDHGRGDLRRRPLPVRAPPAGRLGRARLQPRDRAAVRDERPVQLPAPAGGQPARVPDPRGGAAPGLRGVGLAPRAACGRGRLPRRPHGARRTAARSSTRERTTALAFAARLWETRDVSSRVRPMGKSHRTRERR